MQPLLFIVYKDLTKEQRDLLTKLGVSLTKATTPKKRRSFVEDDIEDDEEEEEEEDEEEGKLRFSRVIYKKNRMKWKHHLPTFVVKNEKLQLQGQKKVQNTFLMKITYFLVVYAPAADDAYFIDKLMVRSSLSLIANM